MQNRHGGPPPSPVSSHGGLGGLKLNDQSTSLTNIRKYATNPMVNADVNDHQSAETSGRSQTNRDVDSMTPNAFNTRPPSNMNLKHPSNLDYEKISSLAEMTGGSTGKRIGYFDLLNKALCTKADDAQEVFEKKKARREAERAKASETRHARDKALRAQAKQSRLDIDEKQKSLFETIEANFKAAYEADLMAQIQEQVSQNQESIELQYEGQIRADTKAMLEEELESVVKAELSVKLEPDVKQTLVAEFEALVKEELREQHAPRITKELKTELAPVVREELRQELYEDVLNELRRQRTPPTQTQLVDNSTDVNLGNTSNSELNGLGHQDGAGVHLQGPDPVEDEDEDDDCYEVAPEQWEADSHNARRAYERPLAPAVLSNVLHQLDPDSDELFVSDDNTGGIDLESEKTQGANHGDNFQKSADTDDEANPDEEEQEEEVLQGHGMNYNCITRKKTEDESAFQTNATVRNVVKEHMGFDPDDYEQYGESDSDEKDDNIDDAATKIQSTDERFNVRPVGLKRSVGVEDELHAEARHVKHPRLDPSANSEDGNNVSAPIISSIEPNMPHLQGTKRSLSVGDHDGDEDSDSRSLKHHRTDTYGVEGEHRYADSSENGTDRDGSVSEDGFESEEEYSEKYSEEGLMQDYHAFGGRVVHPVGYASQNIISQTNTKETPFVVNDSDNDESTLVEEDNFVSANKPQPFYEESDDGLFLP